LAPWFVVVLQAMGSLAVWPGWQALQDFLPVRVIVAALFENMRAGLPKAQA